MDYTDINNTHPAGWLMFMISRPTSNTTLRMRLWRNLKSIGCGSLRDGVYLLPENTGGGPILAKMAEEIIKTGRQAHLLNVAVKDEKEAKTFKALFDRRAEYSRLETEMVFDSFYAAFKENQ